MSDFEQRSPAPAALPRDFLLALSGDGWLSRLAERLRRGANLDVAVMARTDPARASCVLCNVLASEDLEPMEVKCIVLCLGQLGFRHCVPILRQHAQEHHASGVRVAATAAFNAVAQAAAESGADELLRRRIMECLHPVP